MIVLVNGAWGSWFEGTSECSQTCYGGTTKRIRECNNPEPKYGGLTCSGVTEKFVPCNSDIACGTESHQYTQSLAFLIHF